MTAEMELKLVLGYREDAVLAPTEIEIEYETELAHLDARKKRLEALYARYVAEMAEEKKAEAIANGTSIDEAGLPDRALQALKKLGVKNISDVVMFTRKHLASIPTFGIKNVQRLEYILHGTGLDFAPEDEGEESIEATAEAPAADTTEAEPKTMEEEPIGEIPEEDCEDCTMDDCIPPVFDASLQNEDNPTFADICETPIDDECDEEDDLDIDEKERQGEDPFEAPFGEPEYIEEEEEIISIDEDDDNM